MEIADGLSESISMHIFLNEEKSLFSVIVSLVLFGLGFLPYRITKHKCYYETQFLTDSGEGVSGIVGTMRLTDQMCRQGIAMLVLAIYLGWDQITPENYSI